jgi:hypothetical protein
VTQRGIADGGVALAVLASFRGFMKNLGRFMGT